MMIIKLFFIFLLLHSFLVNTIFATSDINENLHIELSRVGSPIKSVIVPEIIKVHLFFNGGLNKSDGSEQGTTLVKKDIYKLGEVCTLGNTMYFIGNDGVHGYELWKSDGTENGTVMVKDNYVGSRWGAWSLVKLNDALFFFGNEGTKNGLFKSDGTTEGTKLITDRIWVDPEEEVMVVRNTIIFRADDNIHGDELWKTDGTDQGTVMIKDIRPGNYGSGPKYFINANGTMFFDANDGNHGFELWKTDGTSNGTVIVKDIWPGSYNGSPRGKINVNSTIFFAADDSTKYGNDLWKSDGTPNGTVKVKDLSLNEIAIPIQNSYYNGFFYLIIKDEKHGRELWRSDGTAQGTVLVKDIWPGPDDSTNTGSRIQSFQIINGISYFKAFDNINPEIGIWKTDGTTAGTLRLNESALEYMTLMQIKYGFSKKMNVNLNVIHCN